VARLVIVANRVPSARERVTPQAGGLTVALRDALGSRPVLWFGWTGAVSEEGIGAPSIGSFGSARTATVDLTRADLEGYYNGYANATLWPLLHYRLGLVDFNRGQFKTYCRVNDDLAAALHPLLGADDEIWVNDYQLIPFGAALRALGVRAPIGFFLHVPFPPPAVFDVLARPRDAGARARRLRPGRRADAAGSPSPAGVSRRFAGRPRARRGHDPSSRGGSCGSARSASASTPTASRGWPRRRRGAVETARLAGSIHGRRLVIGVDRLDYSKGLPERFAAFDAFLDAYPEHRGRVTFLQVAPTSRGEVQQYRALRRELRAGGGTDQQPLRPNTTGSRSDTSTARCRGACSPGFYRLSRVGLVTPLRDGMNLVAKEFVAAQRPDDPGAPGAVALRRRGRSAWTPRCCLNPLDTDGVASAIHAALTMPLPERIERWARLMAVLREHDAKSWVDSFLDALAEPALA
jgi:trehalose 6-phosphate synthase